MGVDVFVDLRRVYIDLKDLCILRKPGGIAGNTVTEAGACHDQKITLAHSKVGGLGSMHAEHTGVELIGSVKRTLSHQGIGNRCLDLVSQYPQLLGCTGKHCSAAHENEWLLAVADQLQRSLDILLSDGIGLTHDRSRLLRSVFILCRSHILGDIDQDRTRSAALCDGKRPAYGIGQLFDIFYDEIVFGDRHGHAGDVDLLKAVAAQQAHANITGNGYHWDGIHECGRNTSYQVGSTRAGSSQAYTNLSRNPRITVRSMGCALLMGGQDVGNLILMLVKRIIDI